MQTWRIVFYGEILEGYTLDDVKAKLAQAFNASPERIAKMFSGKEYVVRKDIPKEKLDKYLAVLEKMGMKVYPHLEESTAHAYASTPDVDAQAAAFANNIKAPDQAVANAAASLHIVLDDNEVMCPRCSRIQPRRTLCSECGLDMPGHWAIEEKNKADLKARDEMFKRQQASAAGKGSVRAGNMYAYNSQSSYENEDRLYEKELPPPQLGLSFEGRWGRVSYVISWYSTILVAIVIGILAGLVAAAVPFVGWLIAILLVLCPVAYNIRIVALRLHDLGLSGWWVVPMLCLSAGSGIFPLLAIPYLLFVLYTVFWPGQKQANHYGQPPEMGSIPIMVGCIVLSLIASKLLYDNAALKYQQYVERAVQERSLDGDFNE